MRVGRLKLLSAHLKEVVSPKQFNILFWYLEADKCGTVACALGHAFMMESFSREGLDISAMSVPVYTNKNGISVTGLAAGEEFFDLTIMQASYLFISSHYAWVGSRKVAPKDVALHIDEMIATHYEETGQKPGKIYERRDVVYKGVLIHAVEGDKGEKWWALDPHPDSLAYFRSSSLESMKDLIRNALS